MYFSSGDALVLAFCAGIYLGLESRSTVELERSYCFSVVDFVKYIRTKDNETTQK